MSEQKRPVVYSLYVVNKAGGLIFHHDYSNIPKLNANDYLMLASTFHSLHAIAGQCVQGAGETKGACIYVNVDANVHDD